jgi:predicted ATPase
MPQATNSVLIHHLAPQNFLSFGPDNAGIELRALNVFIGPNGSGKSNLIEAISILRAAPKDIGEVTRKGGGVSEWIWKGGRSERAELSASFNKPNSTLPLVHDVAFGASGGRFDLMEEKIHDLAESGGMWNGYYSSAFTDGGPTVARLNSEGGQDWEPVPFKPGQSILSQLRDPVHFPEVTWLADVYGSIRIYREWAFGRSAVFREPQKADMRNDTLEEDFSNLGLFLNRLKTRSPTAKKAILGGLKDLYDGITDFDVLIEGGTVQVFFTEGDFVIPATRLSDGTLRYLCLLAILCDPEPPPLICIEEPELGLHPDILPKVADLLKSASERTQIIVTTHSDILVDAMTDCPATVVVCEKHEGKTEMNRLAPAELAVWLEKYRLGQLWVQGHLGGTRW